MRIEGRTTRELRRVQFSTFPALLQILTSIPYKSDRVDHSIIPVPNLPAADIFQVEQKLTLPWFALR